MTRATLIELSVQGTTGDRPFKRTTAPQFDLRLPAIVRSNERQPPSSIFAYRTTADCPFKRTTAPHFDLRLPLIGTAPTSIFAYL
ncbi:hypothetical protein PGTUg99_017557 [Puccinia graminis f. sp. tritici]|uniref:Uncharacterized protein n=1 Tax=Puccinia graminis f. sp. tritici TaxID=56615 RepID=A0A5B0M9S8_PUCGR|nr:hypothetical protein PGTUg99_017557 [Puccinia graminis f. sp. tritici]